MIGPPGTEICGCFIFFHLLGSRRDGGAHVPRSTPGQKGRYTRSTDTHMRGVWEAHTLHGRHTEDTPGGFLGGGGLGGGGETPVEGAAG